MRNMFSAVLPHCLILGEQTRTTCEIHKEVQTRLQSNFDLLEAIWEVSSDPWKH